MTYFFSILDWFVNSKRKNSKEDLQNSRLLVSVFLVSVIFSAPYYILYVVAEYEIAIWSLTFICFTGIAGLFAFKYFGSKTFSTNFFVFGGFAGFTSFIMTSGGIFSPTIPWLIPSVLICFLFVEKKYGYFWTTLSFLSIIIYTILNVTGTEFPYYIGKEYLQWHYGLTYLGVSIYVLALVVIYNTLVDRNTLELKHLNIKLSESEEELKQQNEELQVISENLNTEKQIVEEKNQQISNSIQYASKIQTALLPSNEFLQKVIPNSFIIYKQRDIIGGDFYFLKVVKNKIVFAVADCTGHGVPGAMMSMLGVALLEEIMDNVKSLKSNEILDVLRERLKKSFSDKNETSNQKDGMDIALLVFDNETKKISYTGANSALYLVRKNSEQIAELTTFKADPMPIGVYVKEKPFTEIEIQLKEDDLIYLFSDGYLSQFGKETDKPLGSKRFKELLLKNSNLELSEQKQNLIDFLNTWQGDKSQTDDILVAGVKIKLS